MQQKIYTIQIVHSHRTIDLQYIDCTQVQNNRFTIYRLYTGIEQQIYNIQIEHRYRTIDLQYIDCAQVYNIRFIMYRLYKGIQQQIYNIQIEHMYRTVDLQCIDVYRYITIYLQYIDCKQVQNNRFTIYRLCTGREQQIYNIQIEHRQRTIDLRYIDCTQVYNNKILAIYIKFLSIQNGVVLCVNTYTYRDCWLSILYFYLFIQNGVVLCVNTGIESADYPEGVPGIQGSAKVNDS